MVIIAVVFSTIFLLLAQIVDMLHSHYNINVLFYQLAVNFNGDTCFTHKDQSCCELPCGTHIAMFLPLQKAFVTHTF